MSLSPAAIKAAPAGTELWDSEVPGLHVRVGATKASYTLKYTTKAGEQRRPKIGDARVLTLTRARDIAREMLAKVALGQDPSADISADRAAFTVRQMCEDYLADGLVKAKKSYAEDVRLVKKQILPSWGARKAASLKGADLIALRRAFAKTPIKFNRLMALVSTIYNFAKLPNPTEGVRRYPERKRRRYMKPDEARAIAAALNRHEATAPRSVAFIRLLLLTGARPIELVQAKWEWLADGVIRHPDAKTGARDIFLSPAAQDIIASMPQVGERILGIGKPRELWETIRKEAGCPDLRLYDLRHSFASTAMSIGMTLGQIGELMGHRNTQTTARYAHLMDEHKRLHANATAKAITHYMEEQPCTTA